ncbi:MAG: carboxy terminal-processing peptidase [Candidatus Cloacimonetes bacterium]|nr:carboxy terminal-processing peptidase [Candidatus Cloacimonadota bacterium]
MKRYLTLLLFVVMAAQLLGSVEITDRNKVVMMEILHLIRQAHYEPQEYDDDYSLRIFNLYLERLDYRKRFFLAGDIEALDMYRDTIDDQLDADDIDLKFIFYRQALGAYERRVEQVRGFYGEILAQPFDYSVDEAIEIEPDNLDWPEDEAALRERWRKWLKYQTILRYFALVEERDKPVDAGLDEIDLDIDFMPGGRLDPEIEAEAREKVLKNTERLFTRLLEKDADDKFALFLNSVLNSIDPHTVYMPPKDREDFDIDMTGQFEGIGARLTDVDGYIKITEIIPGSASWRQGELQPEDRIIKVAQGDEEPLDVIDMPVDEAVKYIRGPKDTEVRLTVLKPGGDIVVIPIVRDVVIIEETYAKHSALRHDRYGKTFGYIRLPGFYRDFSNRVERNSTDDVRAALIELQEHDIDGVIFDLRNNGGGALRDAVSIAGLFIREGPVVQVKDKMRGAVVYRDTNRDIVYDGPLVILINQFSASASEILAAALQDYGRAVIVGSEQSFGKGTVQNLVDLDRAVRPVFDYLKPLGSLKLTIQKFYRINGGTTQWQGVHSEIVLPNTFDTIDIGERDYDYALAFDSLRTVPYTTWRHHIAREALSRASQLRLEDSDAFQLIAERNQRMAEGRDDTLVELDIETMIAERLENRREAKAFRDNQIEHDYITVLDNGEQIDDEAAQETYDNWVAALRKDIYIDEAMSILDDMTQ